MFKAKIRLNYEKYFRNHFLKYLLFKIFRITLKASNETPNSFYLFFRMVFPFERYYTNKFDPLINVKFNEVHKSGELEYMIKYNGGVLIEPNYSWALNRKGEILLFSLPYGNTYGTPFPHYIYYKKKKVIKLNTAISISYNWFNYWHFQNDVLGQLLLLSEEKISNDIPIIIPEKALNLNYVRYFIETDFAKKWKWIFQKSNEYYDIDEIYFCKSIPNISKQFIFSKTIFQEKINLHGNGNKKIFLTRSNIRGRNISNLKDIVRLLEKYNFDVIDSDSISFHEQIVLFSNASVICGTHGAGLTNMLFRYGETCTLIEIFPEDFMPVHYYWLAMELNFNYIPSYGSALNSDSFIFPLHKLEKILNSLDLYAN